MPTYSAQQRIDAMRSAGFPEDKIPTGAAISLAELGQQSDTATVFGDNGESVGVWQIHLPAHPDVSTACAADLECSTRAAYRISSGGTNWNPWGAFTNGSWKKNLPLVEALLGYGHGAPSEGGSDPQPVGPVASTDTESAPATGSNPLTGFQFPKLDLGIIGNIGGGVLFKVLITIVAVALVFVGILRLVGGVESEAIGKVGKAS